VSDAGGASPWWLVAAGTIISALCTAIGKLWSDNQQLRREADARTERLEVDHKRDLRRVIWGPTNPPKK
jgi:hypothetical protein